MLRLRGSHGLPRTAPTPRTFQLLGCGQREDSDPAVFFVLSPDEPDRPERLAHKYIHIGFVGLNGF